MGALSESDAPRLLKKNIAKPADWSEGQDSFLDKRFFSRFLTFCKEPKTFFCPKQGAVARPCCEHKCELAKGLHLLPQQRSQSKCAFGMKEPSTTVKGPDAQKRALSKQGAGLLAISCVCKERFCSVNDLSKSFLRQRLQESN
jgi:hypothetical protein